MRRSAGVAQRPRSTNRPAAVAGRRACTQPVPVRPRWSAAWGSESRGRRGAVAVSRLSCPLVHLSFGEFRFLVASILTFGLVTLRQTFVRRRHLGWTASESPLCRSDLFLGFVRSRQRFVRLSQASVGLDQWAFQRSQEER